MTTIISKKITVSKDRRGKQTNSQHAKKLLEYMATPENTNGQEKCRRLEFSGFVRPLTDKDEALLQLTTLFDPNDQDEEHRRSLFSHWILSFSGDDPPTDDNIISAAKEFLRDLGYSEHHPAAFAIHADTDNTHVHILSSRLTYYSDSPLQEGNGWWKNEAQRSNARLAMKYGWGLEENARFVCTGEKEIVKEKHVITDEMIPRERYKATPAPKPEAKAKPLKQGAIRAEMRTNKKSMQRMLQERLIEFEKHINPNWKWGNFHNELAKMGIEAEINYDVSRGLAYTLDGEVWFKASSLCDDMSQKALEQRLGKKFRNARDRAKAIATEARKALFQEDMAVEMLKTQAVVTPSPTETSTLAGEGTPDFKQLNEKSEAIKKQEEKLREERHRLWREKYQQGISRPTPTPMPMPSKPKPKKSKSPVYIQEIPSTPRKSLKNISVSGAVLEWMIDVFCRFFRIGEPTLINIKPPKDILVTKNEKVAASAKEVFQYGTIAHMRDDTTEENIKTLVGAVKERLELDTVNVCVHETETELLKKLEAHEELNVRKLTQVNIPIDNAEDDEDRQTIDPTM